jgi:NhaC family Na+:H+ antiporter
MIAFVPFLVLIALLICCITVFGNSTLDGASQVVLLIASASCVLVGWMRKRLEWDTLEREMTNKVASCTPSIIILLLIGAFVGGAVSCHFNSCYRSIGISARLTL